MTSTSDPDAPATALAWARGLTKHYEGFSLRGVDLCVDEGEIVGFVGKNGAGKSTTIKALLGLIRTDGGQARLLGTPSETLARPEGAATKEHVGVVFDTVSLPGHLRVRDVGRIHARAFATWDSRRFRQLCSELELPGEKCVKDLSRGMGMKLSLICALSHNPDLLVLDEATAGLDPLAREQALDALRLFMNEPKHAILMSSHITSDLEKIADYIVCIDGGRIVFAVEKDAITDFAGVAQCRAAEFDAVVDSGFFAPGTLHFERSAYGTAVLVPDRLAFAARFPQIVLDRADIDAYMSLMLKGDVR